MMTLWMKIVARYSLVVNAKYVSTCSNSLNKQLKIHNMQVSYSSDIKKTGRAKSWSCWRVRRWLQGTWHCSIASQPSPNQWPSSDLSSKLSLSTVQLSVSWSCLSPAVIDNQWVLLQPVTLSRIFIIGCTHWFRIKWHCIQSLQALKLVCV